MKIVMCTPSYKRADKCETLQYLPGTRVYVSTDEIAEYQKNYPRGNFVGVDPKHQGNASVIRNYILDDNPGDIVAMIDDDLSRIGYHEQFKMNYLWTEDAVMEFIERYTELALQLEVKVWGINVSEDRQNYREYTPFSMVSFVGAPFIVHMDSPLRYDEKIYLKEDYDMTLQHLNVYRKVLRVNKYFYRARQGSRANRQSGGAATYRNLEAEEKHFVMLQKKWGSRIVQRDTLETSRSHKTNKMRTTDFNPILRCPIRGV